MNRSLKRITQTLEQLEKPAPSDVAPPAASPRPMGSATAAPSPEPLPVKVPVSFDLPRSARASASPKSLATLQMPMLSRLASPTILPESVAAAASGRSAVTEAAPTADAAVEGEAPIGTAIGIDPRVEALAPVAPFAVVADAEAAALNLPKFKLPSFANHRNGANPDLAANLLQDMLTSVNAWRMELNQVVRQIQELYREGPIVDGWLECATSMPGSAAVRQSTDRLLDQVEGEEAAEELAEVPEAVSGVMLGQSTYQLCGLNADGRSWSCPCPPEQVPSVSLAIVRHQRLRQLLSRKQDLENRLGSLAESLVKLHSQLL